VLAVRWVSVLLSQQRLQLLDQGLNGLGVSCTFCVASDDCTTPEAAAGSPSSTSSCSMARPAAMRRMPTAFLLVFEVTIGFWLLIKGLKPTRPSDAQG
jgi:hypothetical protein